LNPFVKRRVDIFHQDYTPFRSIGEEVKELVVRKTSFGEVEQTDVIS
jgi:hypothetical protein